MCPLLLQWLGFNGTPFSSCRLSRCLLSHLHPLCLSNNSLYGLEMYGLGLFCNLLDIGFLRCFEDICKLELH